MGWKGVGGNGRGVWAAARGGGYMRWPLPERGPGEGGGRRAAMRAGPCESGVEGGGGQALGCAGRSRACVGGDGHRFSKVEPGRRLRRQ
jgi:hypothetical protein